MLPYLAAIGAFAAVNVVVGQELLDERCGYARLAEKCARPPRRWYFSAHEGKCRRMPRRLCNSNANRFAFKWECQFVCRDLVPKAPPRKHTRTSLQQKGTVPAKCIHDADRGGCPKSWGVVGRWYWYFDTASMTCRLFWNDGCGGNENRFFSKHNCRRTCQLVRLHRKSRGLRIENVRAFVRPSTGNRLHAVQTVARKNTHQCNKCDPITSHCRKNKHNHYTCHCKHGYKKNSEGDCIDRNECMERTSECSPFAFCKNTVGSYGCVCRKDYSGNGRHCHPVNFSSDKPADECDECDERAKCVGGRCVCSAGFHGDGIQCNDLDECAQKESPCDDNAQCRNAIGSFSCLCDTGFAGNGLTCSNSPEVCSEPLDRTYESQCSENDAWDERFYFDALLGCTAIWFGGCNSTGRNLFADVQTCQSLCARRSRSRPRLPPECEEQLDTRYLEQCGDGDDWQRRYFFNATSTECEQIWFDGCAADGKNFFENPTLCRWMCEEPFHAEKVAATDSLTVLPASDTTAARLGTLATAVVTTPPTTTGTATSAYSAPDTSLQPTVGTTSIPTAFETRTFHTQTSGADKATGSSSMVPVKEAIVASFGKIVVAIKPAEESYSSTTGRVEETAESSAQPRLTAYPQQNSTAGSPKEAIIVRAMTTTPLSPVTFNALKAKGTITMADACDDAFDENFASSCGGGNWQPRYFYDARSESCRMFWFDDCRSTSRNIFADLETCQWSCEGVHSRPDARACLEPLDEAYSADCLHGEWQPRYHFDQPTKQCVLFWYGGCTSEGRNMFHSIDACRSVCESPDHQLSRGCMFSFEPAYKQLCGAEFTMRYYFDYEARSCRMFWFGGCKGDNENIFPDMATCQWLCERPRNLLPPRHCVDKFDETYRDSCGGGGDWLERWYFDHRTGACLPFWFDKCTSTSQNIFQEHHTCQRLCEAPYPPYHPPVNVVDQCLEEKSVGHCNMAYPAYYYDRKIASCQPFSYSGCGGNGNRFLTMQQCEHTCTRFEAVPGTGSDCILPLDAGYGRDDDACIRSSGYRFYYNRDYASCGRFWYFGCGGNANRFDSETACQSLCFARRLALDDARALEPAVCFQAEVAGTCEFLNETNARPRFRYDGAQQKCLVFTYSGCGGNQNRFGSERVCERSCGGLIRPMKVATCAHWPSWGPCNQLRWMWYYNLTLGTCEQFLWGGCGGNPNRFSTYEECQKSCEVPGTDVCSDPLDRGDWCGGLQFRYYYNQDEQRCKGFHYTGCGHSQNNFKSMQECEDTCIHKQVVAVEHLAGGEYKGVKPPEKRPMRRHDFLDSGEKGYLKTEPVWADYGHCLGFRYNISGRFTLLHSYLCLMESGGECVVERLGDTRGDERCKLMRPWMSGHHLYSWFFTLDRRPRDWHELNATDAAPRPLASLLILGDDGIVPCANSC